MLTRYHYQTFGITIASDFPINSLLPGAPPHDVLISAGKTPKRLSGTIIETDEIQSNREAVLFVIENIGRFYIENGTRIIVESQSGAPANDILAYLLGAAFGALLFQRGLLPLHGSTLNIDGNAVIVVGKSGSGKSTLTRALLNRGGKFMSDDLAAIKTSVQDTALVFPGYPLQKLSSEIISAMEVNPEGRPLDRVMDSVPKYQVPCHDRFFSHPLKVGSIYELSVWDEKFFDITPVRGAQKTSVILTHTYGRYLANGLDITHAFFSQCIDLARTIEVCRISRPKNRFTANEIADAISQR